MFGKLSQLCKESVANCQSRDYSQSAIGGGAEVSAGGSTSTVEQQGFDVLASSEAQALLESGKQSGKLIAEDIATALDELDLDAAQLDEFYSALEEAKIEVVERDEPEADLDEVLVLAGESVVGGVVAADGVAMFRHSIPLDDSAVPAFERSFRTVVEVADRLEEHVTGSDVH